jgi:hypothetical protein
MQERQSATHMLPVLDRANQALVDQLAVGAGPPIYTLTPDEARTLYCGSSSDLLYR